MARDVVTVRLGEAEREAIAKGAAKQGLSFSQFLRQAALLVAHRLSRGPAETVVAAPGDTPAPEPAQPPQGLFDRSNEPHVVNTYASFEQYRANSPYAWSGPQWAPGGQMRNVDPD